MDLSSPAPRAKKSGVPKKIYVVCRSRSVVESWAERNFLPKEEIVYVTSLEYFQQDFPGSIYILYNYGDSHFWRSVQEECKNKKFTFATIIDLTNESSNRSVRRYTGR